MSVDAIRENRVMDKFNFSNTALNKTKDMNKDIEIDSDIIILRV